MSDSRIPGTETMAAANRTVNPKLLMMLVLLVLGTMALSPGVRAEEPQDPGIKEGISAFEAGAFTVALEKLEPLANADNAEAAFWLGRMYEDGLGVDRNLDTAVAWYRKSAENGWVEAKFQLGEIYFRGNEKLQNFDMAYKWLEEAAYDGSIRAQRDLGSLYANGWGVKTDPIWAYVWYEFAAKQGDREAQRLRDNLLGTMPADQVTNAQKLSQEIAPEVFGLVRDNPDEMPDHSGKNGGDAKIPTPDDTQNGT